MFPPPAIAVSHLGKRYGGRSVVDDLSFRVPDGAVLALLGPNGAGKTTTVECIEGFRTPDTGQVRVLGLDPARERDTLLPHLGVMLQEGGAKRGLLPRPRRRQPQGDGASAAGAASAQRPRTGRRR